MILGAAGMTAAATLRRGWQAVWHTIDVSDVNVDW